MKRQERAVLIAQLIERLRENGSWCGMTHLQKAVYFLRTVFDVPFEYEFVLYKHGPYSFELKDEFVGLRADGLFKLDAAPAPYGPKLAITGGSEFLQSRFSDLTSRYSAQIEFVAKIFGSKGVGELERLSTALYVRSQGSSIEERAQLMHELKPHISLQDAFTSVQEVDKILSSGLPIQSQQK